MMSLLLTQRSWPALFALAVLLCTGPSAATGQSLSPTITVQVFVNAATGGSLIQITSDLPGSVIASAVVKVSDVSGNHVSTATVPGQDTAVLTLTDRTVHHGEEVYVQALIRDIAGTERTAVARVTALARWEPELAVTGTGPASLMVGEAGTFIFSVAELNGETDASARVVLREGGTVRGDQGVNVAAGGTVSVSFSVTFETDGDHELTASLEQIAPADSTTANNSTGLSVNVHPAVIPAPNVWLWFQGLAPSRHPALFPSGTIFAATGDINTHRLLSPADGAVSYVSGRAGTVPNSIIWADGATGYLVGQWDTISIVREDGTPIASFLGDYGCCNNGGAPHQVIDSPRSRLLATFGDRLYAVPLYTFSPATFGSALGVPQVALSVAGDVAYTSGAGWVSRWDISGPVPSLVWSKSVPDQYGLQDGAVSADGSYFFTTAGHHASGYWNLSYVWGTGPLYGFKPDGTWWRVDAQASTPAVIGGNDLIFVGASSQTGGLSGLIDTPGVVKAYDASGSLVWSTLTPALPQDLFVGDDGSVYALIGSTTEGQIMVLDQATGAVKLTISQVPEPWEMLLKDGRIYVAGDAGVAAIPLPAGFAQNYDPQSPWPVRQLNNQRNAAR